MISCRLKTKKTHLASIKFSSFRVFSFNFQIFIKASLAWWTSSHIRGVEFIYFIPSCEQC